MIAPFFILPKLHIMPLLNYMYVQLILFEINTHAKTIPESKQFLKQKYMY